MIDTKHEELCGGNLAIVASVLYGAYLVPLLWPLYHQKASLEMY
jgi:hypothetical protein